MFDILQKIHSYNLYLILPLLVAVIMFSVYGMLAKKPWQRFNKILNLMNLIVVDIQFLLGLVLYFGFSSFGIKAFSNPELNVMKDAIVRKIAVEHLVLMLAAWILIHIGYSKIKKAQLPHKSAVVYYGIALVLILAGIPWDRI